MSSKLVGLLLLLSGIVNGAPVIGVICGSMLESLYGMQINDQNLLILLRHRAVLFGLLGGFLIAAVFVPSLRTAAIVAGLISMLSFCALAWMAAGANPAIARSAWIDLALSLALLFALPVHLSAARMQAA